jgi:hypothetical protein
MYTFRLQYMWRYPLAFFSPCWFPFAPLSVPFYLLGTLLPVTGSIHPGPRLLVNWSPRFPPSPFPPHSEILTPWGFPKLNAPLLRRHHNPGPQVQNKYVVFQAKYGEICRFHLRLNTGISENLNRFGFDCAGGCGSSVGDVFYFSTVYIIDKFVVGKTEQYLGFLCPYLLRSQGTAKNWFKVAGAALAVDVAARCKALRVNETDLWTLIIGATNTVGGWGKDFCVNDWRKKLIR